MHQYPFHGGFAWYEINFNELGSGKMNNLDQARESLLKLRDFIDEVHDAYGTDPQNTWLMGFSQGTILSYALCLNEPPRFTKVLALSGYILKALVPDKFKPSEIDHLDFFISHGTQDDVLPVEWARQSVKVLEQLHILHQYREYPLGHGVSPECLEDINCDMKGRDML
ncbi:MAG: phospholipase [Owenweeksia sp.]|nr:phospholipase [Owenweeksia sp.]